MIEVMCAFVLGLMVGCAVTAGAGYWSGRNAGLRDGVKVGLDLWHKWYPDWSRRSARDLDDDEEMKN